MRVFTISNVPVISTQGSGYVVNGYVEGLRERGHHVDLMQPSDFQKAPQLRPAHRMRLQLGYTKAVLQASESGQYDCIHAFGAEAWRAFDILKSKKNKPLLLQHSNGVEPHVNEQLAGYNGKQNTFMGGIYNRFQHTARAFSRADAVVTVSKFDLQYIIQKCWQDSESAISIDNPLPDYFLSQSINLERQPCVGYCGNWIERKGSEVIQKALPVLANTFPQLRFELLGTSDGLDLQETFPQACLKRITHIPKLDRESLQAHYRQWTIALMPAHYESFGLAAAEAMASGAALVASRTGFAAGLQDGYDVIHLNRATSQELIDKVSLLIRDDNLRKHIAQHGWQRVQSLSWTTALNTFENFLQKLIAHKP